MSAVDDDRVAAFVDHVLAVSAVGDELFSEMISSWETEDTTTWRRSAAGVVVEQSRCYPAMAVVPGGPDRHLTLDEARRELRAAVARQVDALGGHERRWKLPGR